MRFDAGVLFPLQATFNSKSSSDFYAGNFRHVSIYSFSRIPPLFVKAIFTVMTVSLEVLNRKNSSLYILFPTLRGGFRSHTRIIMYKYVCCAHVLCLLSILIFANSFLFKAKRRVRGHCAGKPCLMKTVDFSGNFPQNIFNHFPGCTRTCERRYCAA